MWQQSSGKSVTGVNNLCFSCQIDSMFQSQIHLASFGFMVDSVASWSDRFHESFWRDFGFMVNNVASFSQILDQCSFVCTSSSSSSSKKKQTRLYFIEKWKNAINIRSQPPSRCYFLLKLSDAVFHWNLFSILFQCAPEVRSSPVAAFLTKEQVIIQTQIYFLDKKVTSSC